MTLYRPNQLHTARLTSLACNGLEQCFGGAYCEASPINGD